MAIPRRASGKKVRDVAAGQKQPSSREVATCLASLSPKLRYAAVAARSIVSAAHSPSYCFFARAFRGAFVWPDFDPAGFPGVGLAAALPPVVLADLEAAGRNAFICPSARSISSIAR